MKDIVAKLLASEQQIEQILRDLNMELNKESMSIYTVDLSTIGTPTSIITDKYFQCKIVLGSHNNH